MSNIIHDTLDKISVLPGEFCPCFAGPPGIGKTQMIKQWMKKNRPNGKVVTILASTMPPDEVVGYVVPDKQNKVLVHHDPEKLKELTDNDLLFFDELLEGTQETLSACLTLIQERELASGTKLPPNLIICAATNMNVNSRAIKFNIKQRFDLINVHFSIRNWIQYVNDTLDIDVSSYSDTLRDNLYIKEDAESWNQLTPRKLYKLLMLGKEIDQDKLFELIESLEMNTNVQFDTMMKKIFQEVIDPVDLILESIERTRDKFIERNGDYAFELRRLESTLKTSKDAMGFLEYIDEYASDPIKTYIYNLMNDIDISDMNICVGETTEAEWIDRDTEIKYAVQH